MQKLFSSLEIANGYGSRKISRHCCLYGNCYYRGIRNFEFSTIRVAHPATPRLFNLARSFPVFPFGKPFSPSMRSFVFCAFSYSPSSRVNSRCCLAYSRARWVISRILLFGAAFFISYFPPHPHLSFEPPLLPVSCIIEPSAVASRLLCFLSRCAPDNGLDENKYIYLLEDSARLDNLSLLLLCLEDPPLLRHKRCFFFSFAATPLCLCLSGFATFRARAPTQE